MKRATKGQLLAVAGIVVLVALAVSVRYRPAGCVVDDASGIEKCARYSLWALSVSELNANSAAIQAISTLVSAFVACALLFVSRRQTDLFKKQTELAEKQLTHTQRAFLSVGQYRAKTSYRIEGDAASGVLGIRVYVRWINRGNTPTKNTVVTLMVKPHYGTLPDDFEFRGQLSSKRYEIDLSPGASRYIGSVFIGRDDIDRALSPQDDYRLYLIGRADYRDVFDGTELHSTTFCVRMKIGAHTAQDGHPVDFSRHGACNQAT